MVGIWWGGKGDRFRSCESRMEVWFFYLGYSGGNLWYFLEVGGCGGIGFYLRSIERLRLW